MFLFMKTSNIEFDVVVILPIWDKFNHKGISSRWQGALVQIGMEREEAG
jgi:hypothetical protein